MGDGIQEAVLLLISPNLPHQKDGVDDQSCDEQSKEDDAKYERDNLAPVENDPTDIEDDRQGNETSPKGDEERDGFGTARDAHDVLVYASAELAPALKSSKEGTTFCDGRFPRPIGGVRSSVAA